MGAGGGGDYFDDYAAPGNYTTELAEETVEAPKPTWQQPSPFQAQADDPDPTEWTIIWLRWSYKGAYEVEGTVRMTRVELDQHLQANMSFDVTDGVGRKGIIPAGRVVWSGPKKDER